MAGTGVTKGSKQWVSVLKSRGRIIFSISSLLGSFVRRPTFSTYLPRKNPNNKENWKTNTTMCDSTHSTPKTTFIWCITNESNLKDHRMTSIVHTYNDGYHKKSNILLALIFESSKEKLTLPYLHYLILTSYHLPNLACEVFIRLRISLGCLIWNGKIKMYLLILVSWEMRSFQPPICVISGDQT